MGVERNDLEMDYEGTYFLPFPPPANEQLNVSPDSVGRIWI